MSQDISVTPKERVNITYKSKVGDVQEEVELPLKLLVLDEFKTEKDETPIEERETFSINKNNFNNVLKKQGVKLNIKVPNVLANKNSDELTFDLPIDSIDKFSPENIVQSSKELREVYELREALNSLKGPLSNIRQFRPKIEKLIKDENLRAQLLEELGLAAGNKDKQDEEKEEATNG